MTYGVQEAAGTNPLTQSMKKGWNFEEIPSLPEQTAAQRRSRSAGKRGKNSKKWQSHFFDTLQESATIRDGFFVSAFTVQPYSNAN